MSHNMVMRTTNIRFPSHSEMENCLETFEITFMKESVEKILKDGEYILDERQAEALRRHNIPVEESENIVRRLDYSAEGKIRSKFDLACSLDLYYGVIKLTTYDLNPKQHKLEVRKLYWRLQKKCPGITYDCETERTNSNCLA